MKQERDPNRLWLEYGDAQLIPDGDQYIVDDGLLAVWRGPEILLQTVILNYGEKTDDGVLVQAAAIPWFEIARQISSNPDFINNFSQEPRKFEEFLAGAYREAKWDEVTLTPSRGDKGRDVIAVRRGVCAIRVLDQAKAYSPGHLVTHNDVRALVGVLSIDQNASKGLITTTSDFEPGVLSGDEFSRLIPYRLELKNRTQLLSWLADIRTRKLAITDV